MCCFLRALCRLRIDLSFSADTHDVFEGLWYVVLIADTPLIIALEFWFTLLC